VQVALDASDQFGNIYRVTVLAKLLQYMPFTRYSKDAHEQSCANLAAVLIAPKAM
jgi:hypothetical protein